MTEIPTPCDVRTGFHIQYDIGGHVRNVFQSLPGNDRGKRRKLVSLAVRTGLGIAIGGLHHHVRFMVRKPTIDRANERHFIEHRGLQRQVLANLDPR